MALYKFVLNLTRRRRIRLKTFPNVSFLKQEKGLEMQEKSLCASCGGQQKRKRYRNIQRSVWSYSNLRLESARTYISIYMPITNIIPGFDVARHSPHVLCPATHAHEVGMTGEDLRHKELLLAWGSSCPTALVGPCTVARTRGSGQICRDHVWLPGPSAGQHGVPGTQACTCPCWASLGARTYR